MRPVRKADKLFTVLCRCQEMWEPLISWNPLGHSRPVTGLLYLFSFLTFLGRHNVSIPKVSRLVLYSDIIIANCEHNVKTVSILCGQNTGTCGIKSTIAYVAHFTANGYFKYTVDSDV
jgi:hypothetical protein